MTILVTGGAGFIGSNFVLDWLPQCDEPILNLDTRVRQFECQVIDLYGVR